MTTPGALFCDGGVIGKNPSKTGGMYAYRLFIPGVIVSGAGVITPNGTGTPMVSNNQTEYYAMVLGMEQLPDDWSGTIYSDSMVTLGRVFQGYKLTNIPGFMIQLFGKTVARLKNWGTPLIQPQLLGGHPTKDELRTGVRKDGKLVSIHNVWCDEACQVAATQFLDYGHRTMEKWELGVAIQLEEKIRKLKKETLPDPSFPAVRLEVQDSIVNGHSE